jgi:hypothetical protein
MEKHSLYSALQETLRTFSLACLSLSDIQMIVRARTDPRKSSEAADQKSASEVARRFVRLAIRRVVYRRDQRLWLTIRMPPRSILLVSA